MGFCIFAEETKNRPNPRAVPIFRKKRRKVSFSKGNGIMRKSVRAGSVVEVVYVLEQNSVQFSKRGKITRPP